MIGACTQQVNWTSKNNFLNKNIVHFLGPVYYQCKDVLLGQGGYGKVFTGYAITTKTRTPVGENIEIMK